MSEPENFLTRWSRRKQQAELKSDLPDDRPLDDRSDAEAAPTPDALPAQAGTSAAEETKEPEFDVSTLPPVETIGADTDVSVFLQKGVPSHLTRAALSRAWAADPAIRNFIGIAENQWDFASGDLPGFGPLTAADNVARMVAQITTEGLPRLPELKVETAAPELKEERPQEAAPPTESDVMPSRDAIPPPEAVAVDEETSQPMPDVSQNIVQREEEIAALPHSDGEETDPALPYRRPHGRALPQ